MFGKMRTGQAMRGLGVILVLTISLTCAVAEAKSVTISLVPANTLISIDGPDDPLMIDICISNPDQLEIKSWSLDLFFDPGVFDPIAGIGTVPTQGFELGDYIPGVAAQWNPSFDADGVSPDAARMGAINFGAGTGTAVDGLLASVALDAIGTGELSGLGVSGQVILAGGTVLADVVYQPSTVSVVTPEPATLGLWTLGLLAWRRRKS